MMGRRIGRRSRTETGMDREDIEIPTTDWRHGSQRDKYVWADRHPILSKIEAGLIGLVGLAIIVIILGSWVAFDIYDPGHTTPVECTVARADAGEGRFVGNIVAVETLDCGDLELRGGGSTKAQAQQLASRLQRGHRYRFQMGAASHKFEPFVRFMRSTPNVYSFQEVGPR